ncbi:MAG: PAS domain-containing sensor histidine kinase [Anaerolineae bacterium]
MTVSALQPTQTNNSPSDASPRPVVAEAQPAADKFAASYHLSPDPILVTTEPDGRILDANAAYLEFTGYSRDELIGHTTGELQMWVDIAQRSLLVSQLAQHGKVRDLEIAYRRKSGEQGCGLLYAERVLFDGQACVVSILHDITDRKRMETEREQLAQALQQQVRLLDAILSTTPDHIHLHDREGRFLFASPSSLRALALTSPQVIGATWQELGYTELAVQGFDTRLAQVFETEQLAKGEVIIHTVDGPRYFEQLLSPVRDEAGRVVMALSTMRDVTERQQAEETLRRYTADLRGRNEELETFARTVAHDLKSPLGNILGFTELLTARPNLAVETRTDFVETIARNASKMVSIIDELLLLAKVRKGEMVLTPIDMGRIVSEALHRLTFSISEASAAIYTPNSWPAAKGYAPWVEEVWVNYVSNALKYGGQPPHIELGYEVCGNTVRFWVKDDGHGVPAEEREKLFTPFVQLSTMRATGHGLGLSIVRQIVEKMGGTVDCQSSERGSVFSFTLPAAS